MTILDLEPKALWKNFYDICQIPRPSKHEEKMTAFMLDFAKKHNLEAKTDKVGNVVISKPATPGYENHPKIVLQSHMDMVCEKAKGVEHDFDKDAIETYIDGEWLKAKGTTLGADDGIGCATSLTILESDTLKHPAIECLFTVDEETGLTGAFAIGPDFLTGEKLINLDSEDDGQFFIGCAGGIGTTAVFNYTPQPMPDGLFYFIISVEGLMGGHSGDDIDKGRGNANKILNRFLWQTAKKTTLKLASIDGGNKHNAIPRDAHAIAAVPASYKETLRVDLNLFTADVENELSYIEKGLKIVLESTDKPSVCLDEATTKGLLNALYACPHGVLRMSDAMPGMVETSTNLASIKMTEGNTITIVTSQRSFIDSSKFDAAFMVESAFSMAGASVVHSEGYPGWNPNPNSPLAKLAASTYKELFNEEAIVRSIHAGLECGLFTEKYPHMDMVSVGPTMRGVHSPDERLDIKATQKFWKLVTKLLEKS